MSTQFEIVERELGPVVEVEERVYLWQMPSTFRRDYGRIADYLAAQGSEINGMPYARYLEIDWARERRMGLVAQVLRTLTRRWHFMVGMPSQLPLPGAGGLQGRVLQRGRYARTLHRGPYKEVGRSYNAMIDWLALQGERAGSEAIEAYLNSPEEVEASALETELLVLLQ